MSIESLAELFKQRDPKDIADFVIVESPFAGNIVKNLRYVRACMRDAILRGEAPFASHALYTQEGVLRDEVHEEREIGMNLGWHVMRRAQRSVFYTDLGWSSGMVRGYNAARDAGVDYEIRRLGGEWSQSDPGVDYAVVGGPPYNWQTIQVVDAEEPDLHKRYGGLYLEVDFKQCYVVKANRDLKIEVIKFNPGRFRFETVKD